ncbi:hypothetical protein [uncultured Muribaculum sp.]|nr:hypothetical protein [uncultured Muribaculum sp.]
MPLYKHKKQHDRHRYRYNHRRGIVSQHDAQHYCRDEYGNSQP